MMAPDQGVEVVRGTPLERGGITIDQQIACVEREIGLRMKHYPRWVRDHKLTEGAADLEIARMRAVLQSLITLRDCHSADAAMVQAVLDAERERVLDIVARHMASSLFVRVAQKVRAP